MRIMVKKRTGRLQAFSLVKIMRTLEAAGAGARLVQEVAWDVVKEILSDIRRGMETAVIPSERIKKMVVGGLSKKSPRLAQKYEKYKK